MTSGRVVALAILCLPFTLMAQDQRPASSPSSAKPQPALPARQTESGTQASMFTPPFPADKIALSLAGSGDATCYAIRSYVVARDAKDSDSTHPVSYSTCRPAARYALKTVETNPMADGTLDSGGK